MNSQPREKTPPIQLVFLSIHSSMVFSLMDSSWKDLSQRARILKQLDRGLRPFAVEKQGYLEGWVFVRLSHV